MSLFSDPIAPNDGTADRTFVLRAQYQPKAGSVAGEYVRSDGDVANRERILVRHDEAGAVLRSAVSKQGMYTLPADTTKRKRIQANITFYCDPGHSTAQIKAEILNLLSLTNGNADPTAAQIAFTDKIVQRLV